MSCGVSYPKVVQNWPSNLKSGAEGLDFCGTVSGGKLLDHPLCLVSVILVMSFLPRATGEGVNHQRSRLLEGAA